MSKSRENVGCGQPESWRGRFPPLIALSNTSSLTSARRSVWRFRAKPFTIWDCASTNASRPVRIGIFCFRRQPCAASPTRLKSRVFIAGGHMTKAQDRSILKSEWARNYQSIRSKLENTSIILPKGESSRIIELVEASYRLGSVETERDDAANRLRAVQSERDDLANRLRAAEIERDEAAKIKSRLRRPMRRHVKRRIIMLRVQRALSFWSHRRRGRLRAKIGEYKGLLRRL